MISYFNWYFRINTKPVRSAHKWTVWCSGNTEWCFMKSYCLTKVLWLQSRCQNPLIYMSISFPIKYVHGFILLFAVVISWALVDACNACIHIHDDVIKWKHFLRNWPFVRGIHRSPVNSPHKGQWRGALMFTLICARINGWVNTREAGDLRRYLPHYDVIVMRSGLFYWHLADQKIAPVPVAYTNPGEHG